MRAIKIFPFFPVVSFCLFFCGISRHDANPEALSKLASSKQFDCVGKALENGKFIGSGVLITPRFVLSATHVLMTANQMFTKRRKLNDLEPGDFSLDFNGNIFKVKRIITYTGRGDYSTETETDLVLLELDRDVNNIALPGLNTKLNELGTQVTGVGYGIYGIVNEKGRLKIQNSGVKSAGKNIIDKLAGKEVNGKPAMLQFDFDSPLNPAVSKMGSDHPIEMEYTPSGGDSGGGLFREAGGKMELIGILHSTQGDIENFRINGYYGEVSNWTRVSVFTDWIKSSIIK
ncbi:trypsin-like serine protease [Pedobacter mendelii]|nr:trypsin-like serine protease [Pedobacter mendelii]